MLRKIARFTLGSLIGLLLWVYGTPVYAQFVSFCLRGGGARLIPNGNEIYVLGPGLPPAHIPFEQLTYNVILFCGLFAMVVPAWRRLIIATVVLVLSHIAATAISVAATYATRMGAWSDAHFMAWQQDLLTALDYSYRLGGMFAIAFACWYLAADIDKSDHRTHITL